MWNRLACHRACAQCLAVALPLLLAACAADPERVVVSVTAPLPPAPDACRTRPKPPPSLPDRDMPAAELAQAYARLKARYARETGRYALCQAHVARLGG